MSAIVAGVLTALFFAVSSIGATRAARLSPTAPAVVGVMAVGALLLLPAAPLSSGLPTLTVEPLSWAALSGASNAIGLLLIYAAFRAGAVGIVATIASTEGAVAAVLAVLAGQFLTATAAACLAVIVAGVALTASSGGEEIENGARITRAQSTRSALLAAGAAAAFGFGLFAIGRATADLSPAWTILIGRLVGILLLGAPLLVLGRVAIPRAAWPFVVLAGVGDVAGYATYAIGASTNIALTAVLGSMFAPVAAVAAYVLFGERLARRQVAGIGVVVLGVAALAAITA